MFLFGDVAHINLSLIVGRFGNYMVDSIVASLENSSPFLSVLDSYGFPTFHNNFAAAGTCKYQLLGLCETFWKPKLVSE